MFRPFILSLIACVGLAACGDATRDLKDRPDPLGDFSLGFVAAAAPSPQKLLVSRAATSEEWVKVVEEAYLQRFGRFDGEKRYNMGLRVEAYSLPPPLVPGKSAVQIAVTVWDDAAASKLNDKPEPIAVIKVFETRLASSREESMKALAEEAALETEKWLRAQQAEQGWFGGPVSESEDTMASAAVAGNTVTDETVAAGGSEMGQAAATGN
ncbi:hypothetical protein [Primorskyibacter flagellatus]|uniref:DUF3576 domain-containing protein n=1 Tax=Primorskyibacter flagellatus TaxID=1387277 RepID=A0A1W2AZI3_9RHOB|nr:hypothetical protein [Primorskyibacter flagellatus]SMC66113.1 hypothetical protein SAMN06295998_103420 [Primorskyibacter flagellatus]